VYVTYAVGRVRCDWLFIR